MTEEIDEDFLNLDDLQVKRNFMGIVGSLRGTWKIEGKRKRPTRSLRQNAYYFGVVVKAFWKWRTTENQEQVTQARCHSFLAKKYLTVSAINHKTGEEMGEEVRSTTELNTVEFGEYIEECRNFIADYCHVVVPDPDPMRIAG